MRLIRSLKKNCIYYDYENDRIIQIIGNSVPVKNKTIGIIEFRHKQWCWSGNFYEWSCSVPFVYIGKE